MTDVQFYSANEESDWWVFSNFAMTPLTINDLDFPTVEHYLQFMKFQKTDPEYAELIRMAETPIAARKMGKSVQHKNR